MFPIGTWNPFKEMKAGLLENTLSCLERGGEKTVGDRREIKIRHQTAERILQKHY